MVRVGVHKEQNALNNNLNYNAFRGNNIDSEYLITLY